MSAHSSSGSAQPGPLAWIIATAACEAGGALLASKAKGVMRGAIPIAATTAVPPVAYWLAENFTL